ncbi:gamma-aminobutyric acid receptor subunit beta-4-like [Ornithodoros turicata]|uniref:gamma-aminobutyric acid receptor subunit beta-4-like n=1 Tax=Ornithodoros turicata TaxID=34597 RepID=UPI003138A7EC
MRKLAFLDEILEDYDNRAWPTYGTGEPTQITASMFIYNVGPIDEENMDYTLDIYLQETWQDKRLRLSPFGVNETLTIGDNDVVDKIWKPDLFFVNAKEAYTHDITVPNVLLKISADGSVVLNIRLTVRLSCLMDFRLYPMDKQECHMVIRPYAHTMDKAALTWRETKPVLLEFPVELPEYFMADAWSASFVRYHRTGDLYWCRSYLYSQK